MDTCASGNSYMGYELLLMDNFDGGWKVVGVEVDILMLIRFFLFLVTLKQTPPEFGFS